MVILPAKLSELTGSSKANSTGSSLANSSPGSTPNKTNKKQRHNQPRAKLKQHDAKMICYAGCDAGCIRKFWQEMRWPGLNLENFAGKMTIPSKSLLSLLASCLLYCYAYVVIPTTCFIMPPIFPCQTSNPPCPSKLLFGYVTALLSPSYSVASCKWRWRLKFVPCWNIVIVGI